VNRNSTKPAPPCYPASLPNWPPPTLARLLGIHIKVAVQWQHAAAGDWTTYAADYSRRANTSTTNREQP
jgi:hypothetical protein